MFSNVAGDTKNDTIARTLSQIAEGVLVVIFGLLPILFVPLAVAPYAYSKVLFVVAAVAAALVFFALATLRSGELRLSMPIGLMALWGVALVSVIAAVFSGDLTDALIGDAFSVHSAAFVVLLALAASSVQILKHSKTNVIRLYTLFTVSALILGVFHAARLLGGPDVLSFGMFTSPVASLVGSWNDLALFFGLAILLALVAVEQLPLTKWGRIVLVLVTALALLMLAVVNFFAVWLVLATVSLVMLMYSLTKHRFKQASLGVEKHTDSLTSIALSAAVFVASVLFIVGGSALGGWISNVSNISYVEVRPSFSATLDITGAVYQDNAFVGIGPNKFVDAWRLYKDPAINQTVFWDTNFDAGNGYVTTAWITTGIFGLIAWVAFLALLLWSGFRMLFGNQHTDRFWYFIGTSSFVAALYLWGMSIIYVPTVTTLILAAVCTGVMFAAYSNIVPQRMLTLSMLQHKRVGFVLVMLAVVIIVGAVSTLYFTGRHYTALYAFNQARASIASGASIDAMERAVVNAYALSGNDRFAREIAEYQLRRLTSLAAVAEPTEAQQQQFQEAAVNGVNAAQLATDADPTEPRNWRTLGQIYSLLGMTGVEGSFDLAIAAYNEGEKYNPTSPVYPLLRAQVESRRGNLEAARSEAEAAVAKKRDLTEAIFFLSQIDIAEGNLTQAIARTQAIATLEPQNAARYYQLGILHSADNNLDQAVQAFRGAVAIDPDYANARYLLALGLAEQGDPEAAIAELQYVLELNPGNEQVLAVIEALQEGAIVPAVSDTVSERTAVAADGDSVTTTEDPDTSLISPVNTVPDSSTDAEAETAPTEENTEGGTDQAQ